jgi:HAD superfamily hydrolase (TIGR01458 family)
LLDIDGTLTRGLGGPPIEGAVEAVARLGRQLPLRLVTNATSRPLDTLLSWLRELGLLRDAGELVTPVTTARRVLEARGHAAGLLLVDPACRGDYGWFTEDPEGPAVLLGTQAHELTVGGLQPAFRALMSGAKLYTLQRSRYFRQGEQLVTDLGPVAAFLEYASDGEAENLGKPSPGVYQALAAEAGVALEEMLMVGDDAEFDASGAVALGMAGVLVRTGKYREGDEERVTPRPTAVIDSVASLPCWLGLA